MFVSSSVETCLCGTRRSFCTKLLQQNLPWTTIVIRNRLASIPHIRDRRDNIYLELSLLTMKRGRNDSEIGSTVSCDIKYLRNCAVIESSAKHNKLNQQLFVSINFHCWSNITRDHGWLRVNFFRVLHRDRPQVRSNGCTGPGPSVAVPGGCGCQSISSFSPACFETRSWSAIRWAAARRPIDDVVLPSGNGWRRIPSLSDRAARSWTPFWVVSPLPLSAQRCVLSSVTSALQVYNTNLLISHIKILLC